MCLCASESVYGLALSGSHYGMFEYACADSNGSGSTQGPERRWSELGRKMSDRARGRGGSVITSAETETERRERQRRAKKFGLHPFLLFASAADVVVRKGGGKNQHKVIIIHMNAD